MRVVISATREAKGKKEVLIEASEEKHSHKAAKSESSQMLILLGFGGWKCGGAGHSGDTH